MKKKICDSLTRNMLIALLMFAFIISIFVGLPSIEYKNLVAHANTGTEIAESDLNSLKENISASGKEYIRVYNEEGVVETFESPLEDEYVEYFSSKIYSETINNSAVNSRSITNPFDVTTIVDSGLPDSESIVVVFMGDGYTAGTQANQQGSWPNPVAGSFLAQAKNAAETLINTHPFSLFSHLFKVYAIQVISNDVGISRMPDGKGPIKDTYFHSYCSDPGYIAIESEDKIRAFELANTVSDNNSMIQILANENAHGGTAYTIVSDGTTMRVSIVATQSTSNTYWSPAWHGTMVHEFGHSLGQLIDEHERDDENPFISTDELRPNITQVSDPATIKWSHWIGYEDITIRSVGNGWYVPAEDRGGCLMRASWANSEFCAVCATELTRRMAALSGETFYGKTSNDVINIPNVTIPADETRILHYAFSGNTTLETIEISESVQTIGDYAFLGASGLTTIINKSRTPQVINESTFAGLTLSDITVYIPEGKVDAYRNAGWTDFNMVEMPLFKTNDTGSTIIGLNYIPSGDIVIPNVINGTTITSISSEVFLNCSELESVTLPATLTMMGDDVFAGCTNLEKVIVSNKTTIPSIGTNCFANIEDLTIYVSYSLENLFEIATNWHAYANDITGCYFDEDGKVFLMEDKITSVAQRAGLITLSSFDFDDVWADPELYLINEAFIAVGGGRIFYVAFDYNFNLGEVIDCTLKIEVDAQTSCLLFDGDQEFVEECFIEDGILAISYTEIYNNGGEFYLLPLEFYVQPIQFEITDITLEYTVKVYI